MLVASPLTVPLDSASGVVPLAKSTSPHRFAGKWEPLLHRFGDPPRRVAWGAGYLGLSCAILGQSWAVPRDILDASWAHPGPPWGIQRHYGAKPQAPLTLRLEMVGTGPPKAGPPGVSPRKPWDPPKTKTAVNRVWGSLNLRSPLSNPTSKLRVQYRNEYIYKENVFRRCLVGLKRNRGHPLTSCAVLGPS